MFEIIKAGGWVMVPIIACSILALAIIVERFWALRPTRIIPAQLVPEVWNKYRQNQLDSAYIRRLRAHSPLGAVLAARAYELLSRARSGKREYRAGWAPSDP